MENVEILYAVFDCPIDGVVARSAPCVDRASAVAKQQVLEYEFGWSAVVTDAATAYAAT